MLTPLNKYIFLFFSLILLINCKEEVQTISTKDSVNKQNEVFKEVSQLWVFTSKTLTPEAQNYLNNWEDWRIFNEETNKKPIATISAFQQKSKLLTEKVMALENTLPVFYQKPEIKARLKVLLSHFQSLEMYLQLNNIPVKKVKFYLTEINKEWQALVDKMNELQFKSVIPKEEGEMQMIKLSDTVNQKSLDFKK
jgi:hypothetical protein